MTEEILQHMKENNGVAVDQVTDDNIRQVVIFYDTGHFCGYIGLPEDNMLFNYAKNYTKADNVFQVHGGVSYVDTLAPGYLQKDEKRKWIGFDFNHLCDGHDIDLVREVYGDERAERAERLIYRNDRKPVSFEEVLSEVEEMCRQAREYELKNTPCLHVDLKFTDGSVVKDRLVPFTAAENSNGVFDKEIIKEYLKTDADVDVYVEIAVPFSDALLAADDHDTIMVDDEFFNRLDDCPELMEARIPLDLMQKFYDDVILTEEDYKSGEDIHMNKWLTQEYTLDETEGMLSWMENHDPDFDAHSVLDPSIDDWLEKFVKEENEVER